MKTLKRLTICRIRGHLSTGTMFWWMCDRCHSDFTDKVKFSKYIGDTKVTRS